MKKSILLTSALSIVASSLLADVFSLGQIDIADSINNTDVMNATVLDAQTMQEQNTKTLPEALNLLSGINIQNSGARNEQMIMMRGFDVKHAPLFIDGIPVAVPYDGYVDFTRFATFDLSEIDVSKGFASVLLGPNTFAGAINMVSKKPTKEFEGEVGAGVFSGNGKDAYATFGSNQGKFYVQGSYSGMSRDDYPLSANFSDQRYQKEGNRDNAYAVDNKINLKAGYTPNATDEYAINYIKQHASKGVPPYAGEFDLVLTDNAYYASNPSLGNNTKGGGTVHFWQWNYWDKESYYFLSKTDFGNWYVKTRAFYDKFENSLAMYTNTNYNTLTPSSANASFYDDNVKGASAEVGFKLSDKDSLKFAAHYQLDSHKEGGWDSVTGVAAPTYEMQDQIASYGVEYKRALTDSTTLTLGASYDVEKALKAENTNYSTAAYSGSTKTYWTQSSGGTEIAYRSMTDFALGDAAALNPLAKVEIKLDDSWSVYGGVSKKSRIPAIKDRYSFKMGQFIPNPDLKEESAISYEVGTAKKFANAYVKASLFATNVGDYIQSVYVPVYYGTSASHTTQEQQLQNVGTMTQRGAELEGTYMLNDQLSFDGSYTHLDVKNSDSSIKITDVPADKLIVSNTFSPIEALSWINSFEYDSSRFASVGTTGAGVNTKSVYYNTGDVGTWNTKVTYHVTKAFSLDAGVNNILDRNYYISYGYPEAGRSYYANVRYKF